MAPITLHTFGPYFGLPDASPFVLKTIVLMKMSGLPFVEKRGGLAKAPKGKLPYIDDNGTRVADSTLIRMYLERVHAVDLDSGLTPAERALGWAVERMLEGHAYWFVVRERWLEDANFDRGPRQFFKRVPAALRPFLIAKVRRKMQRTLDLNGVGRFDEDESHRLAKGDFDTIATLLGDKPYLFGDTPHGADATLFGFIAALLVPTIQPKLTALAASHANLRAYVDRMLARYFPDFPLASAGAGGTPAVPAQRN